MWTAPWRHCATAVGWVLLYVHRNRRLIRDGSPGRPPRLFAQLLSSEPLLCTGWRGVSLIWLLIRHCATAVLGVTWCLTDLDAVTSPCHCCARTVVVSHWSVCCYVTVPLLCSDWRGLTLICMLLRHCATAVLGLSWCHTDLYAVTSPCYCCARTDVVSHWSGCYYVTVPLLFSGWRNAMSRWSGCCYVTAVSYRCSPSQCYCASALLLRQGESADMEPSPNELNNAAACVTRQICTFQCHQVSPATPRVTVCRTLNSGMISQVAISPFIYLFNLRLNRKFL